MALSDPLTIEKRPNSAISSHQIDWFLFCCISLLCVGLIAFSLFQALRNARQDPWTAVFAVTAGAVLLMLWLSFRQFEEEGIGSPRRHHFKIAIFTLSILLNCIFSIRVTSIVGSFVLSCFIWGIAIATTLSGASLLFYGSKKASPCTAVSHAIPGFQAVKM